MLGGDLGQLISTRLKLSSTKEFTVLKPSSMKGFIYSFLALRDLCSVPQLQYLCISGCRFLMFTPSYWYIACVTRTLKNSIWTLMYHVTSLKHWFIPDIWPTVTLLWMDCSVSKLFQAPTIMCCHICVWVKESQSRFCKASKVQGIYTRFTYAGMSRTKPIVTDADLIPWCNYLYIV